MKSLLSLVAASVAALILLSMLSIPAGAADSSNLLDGKTFVPDPREKGKPANFQENLVFRDGRFIAEGCAKWGFAGAPYQATVEGGAIRFHAKTHSPTHGAMVWDGIVRGDAIEATTVWTRERWYWNIKKEYLYKGQLKK